MYWYVSSRFETLWSFFGSNLCSFSYYLSGLYLIFLIILAFRSYLWFVFGFDFSLIFLLVLLLARYLYSCCSGWISCPHRTTLEASVVIFLLCVTSVRWESQTRCSVGSNVGWRYRYARLYIRLLCGAYRVLYRLLVLMLNILRYASFSGRGRELRVAGYCICLCWSPFVPNLAFYFHFLALRKWMFPLRWQHSDLTCLLL